MWVFLSVLRWVFPFTNSSESVDMRSKSAFLCRDRMAGGPRTHAAAAQGVAAQQPKPAPPPL